jgi:glutathione synthase/RimK-type ligase-like ATP-grasp enzyme
MITIFVGRDGRPSMKKVFSSLKTESRLVVRRIPPNREPYLRIYSNGNSDKYAKQSLVVLREPMGKMIRWGNRIEMATDKSTIVYNKSEAIANATNKKLSRELFLKNKVRTPQFVTPNNVKDSQYPVIARPSTHAKGKNFIILRNHADFSKHYATHQANGWYYSEFINKEREFRVHCAHGKVLAIMEKAKGGDSIAWNRAQTGEAFTRVPQADYIFSICYQALKATQTLGLDFAGVDVMLVQEGGKPQGYVLEVNTSPTLNSSDHVSLQYALYFDWLNRHEKRREHWDFAQFKNPASFAWKQFQLNDTANTKNEPNES